jgi:hypothetical protein
MYKKIIVNSVTLFLSVSVIVTLSLSATVFNSVSVIIFYQLQLQFSFPYQFQLTALIQLQFIFWHYTLSFKTPIIPEHHLSGIGRSGFDKLGIGEWEVIVSYPLSIFEIATIMKIVQNMHCTKNLLIISHSTAKLHLNCEKLSCVDAESFGI